MKTIIIFKSSFVFFLAFLHTSLVNAQMANLHGTDTEYRMGLHAGNNFRTTFHNDGTWGTTGSAPNQWSGEWPINSGHIYLAYGNIFIISEVNDNYDPIEKKFLTSKGTLRHIQSTGKSANAGSSTGDKGPDQNTGSWWTFLPLPGFANPQSDKIAMAKRGLQWENSWPPFWPDIADPSNPIYEPSGWAGDWNGYFGRNKFNADEESYFIADDYAKQEFQGFRADTNDVSRGGLGIRMYVRGFQWDKDEIADVLFCHYKFKNIGTYNHNKMEFGYIIGNNVGDTRTGGDPSIDGGSYDITENLAWTWDADGHSIASSWGTEYGAYTGVFGACFLESPGNPFDGIDNDNDGINGPGSTITFGMFDKRVLQSNDQIVLIDYNDPHYRRIITTLADTLAKLSKASTDTLTIFFNGFPHYFWAGDSLQEVGDNIFDDNLDGLIDENRGVTYAGITHYLYLDHKYINYLTDEGKNNLLIDERRDDGIDNNGNWNPTTDDVGADGLGSNDRGYLGPDIGEGDGIPSPGEPQFDETDVNESDMLGLTSSFLYPWGEEYRQYDDEKMWQIFTPGTFYTSPPGNVELSFGSGYFSLLPGSTERFSIGMIAADAGTTGKDTIALFETKRNAASVYNNNYKLPTNPEIPTLHAIAKGNKVTLTWDSLAENSYDPVLGSDFEGYRIYRTTNPNIFDSTSIVAQFDLNNEYSGYSPIPHHGHYFWLGTNAGVQHSWIDSNVIYGFDYFYVITSYDHGSNELKIPPYECIADIYTNSSGDVITGKNVIKVIPVDTEGLKYPTEISLVNGLTNGIIKCEIVDTRIVKRKHTYRVTFQDTLSIGQVKNFTLTNITNGDTVLREVPFFGQHRNTQVVDGFRLTLENVGYGEQKMIEDSSGWNRVGVYHVSFNIFPYTINPFVKAIPGDFKISIGDVGIDTSKYFLIGSTIFNPVPVNFTIMNTMTNKKVEFVLREFDTSSGRGKWSRNKRGTLNDQIIFLTLKTTNSDTLIASWQVQLFTTSNTQSDTSLPIPGDVLTIKLTKPFLVDNVFEFTMPDIPAGVSDQDRTSLPQYFSLSQNYPNPFNPTTTVLFSLPIKSKVHLYLIDILGRIVKEITNGNYSAGNHNVTIDASKLASGIYFCRLETNTGFVQTKKLVLIK